MRCALIKIITLFVLTSLVLACTTTTYVNSELQQGERLFEQGYYKRALNQLLPLAANGNKEAEYAVGYMYYYGYGVAQDADVGIFWIKRAADQGSQPAMKALKMIRTDKSKQPHQVSQF